MTKKQFFKRTGLNQSRDKKTYIDLVKKHKGRLSYYWMFKLIWAAIMFGKRGAEIPYYIDAVVESVKRDEQKERLEKLGEVQT